eukprot:5122371-Pyramimonas_sp.AAC.1
MGMLGPLLADAQVAATSDSVDLEGEALAQRFVLRFKGDTGLASRRANKVLGAMRIGPSDWRRLACRTPGGEPVEVSIGPDKNRSQITHELALKKLK